jgi:hypothetical protein
MMLPEIPGLFYTVQFSTPQTSSICLDFAKYLTATLQLTIVPRNLPTFGANQCITELETTGQVPKNAIALVSDPYNNRLNVQITESGPKKNNVSPVTRELGSRVMDAAQKQFPDATVTPAKPPRYNWNGP